MDLNTKELYRQNSLSLFKSFKLDESLDNNYFQSIVEQIESVKITPVQNYIYLFTANKLIHLQKYQFAYQAYAKVPLGVMNFFELMSFLDTCISCGEVSSRLKVISYSIKKIIREKRLNLIDDFILKMKSIRLSLDEMNELLGAFVLCSGDSSFANDESFDVLSFCHGKIDELFNKIDYWEKDPRILEAILRMNESDYEALAPELQDKIKFSGLTYFHKQLIADIGQFKWVEFIDFLITIKRAVGYEEVNRIVFDFNIPIEPVKIIELKSLNADNEKMKEVEKVMGEIGLSESFEEEEVTIEKEAELDFTAIVDKVEQAQSEEVQSVIKDIAKYEPTQAMEYIKLLNQEKRNEIITDLESKVEKFKATDNLEAIREQVNQAYIMIKVCIQGNEFARAFKMMDFVITNFPLAKRELASFNRLKQELNTKWKSR